MSIPIIKSDLSKAIEKIQEAQAFGEDHGYVSIDRERDTVLYFCSFSWFMFSKDLSVMLEAYQASEYYYYNAERYLQCMIIKSIDRAKLKEVIESLSDGITMKDIKELI